MYFRAPFSERDVLELADRIESHRTVVEKLSFYQSFVQDPELSDLVVRFRTLFFRHAQRLESTMRLIEEQSDFHAYSEYNPDSRSCRSMAGGE